MIHRFLDNVVTLPVYDMIWNITRVVGGTDRGFAIGALPPDTLANYIHMMNVNVDVPDRPLMSHDLTRFVFQVRDGNPAVPIEVQELRMANTDGSGGQTLLAVSPADGNTPGREIIPIGWSPDDTQIYYWCTDNVTDDDIEIRRVDDDGTNDTLILATSIPDIAEGVAPRLSHDGTQIAYWIDADSGANCGLWVCDSDGSNNTRIYTGNSGIVAQTPNDFFGWSRDDEWLVYRDQFTGPTRIIIYKIRPDGTDQTELRNETLTTFANNFQLDQGQYSPWLPDGSAILCRRTTATGSPGLPLELGFLATDGSETFTAISPGIDRGGVLNRNGTRIYWYDPTDDQVKSVKVDGSDEQIADDMTDSSTTPQHDDFNFNGFFKTL